MGKLDDIVNKLVKLGEDYPPKKGGYFGMFSHTNQDPAAQLMALKNTNKPNNLNELAQTIVDICKKFTQSGELLKDIIHVLYESKAFPDYNQCIEDIEENIQYANDHNDGGGAVRWNIKNYQLAISKLKETSKEHSLSL